MARHKMSLDIEYVNTWDVQDALRELFQNAIDHEDWRWEYKHGVLTIISENVVLAPRTLLLGHSDKKEGAIGKFGEGYKLAMLVLKRLEYETYLVTGDEVWTPKIINSRTYQAKQLVFDTKKIDRTATSTEFVIHGIDNQTFSDLMDRNLHLRPASLGWVTCYGHILPDSYAGKVFVKGLYVCDIPMRHGYDIYPEFLKLDRDRRIVRDFDLQWITCQMWRETDEFDYILDMIESDEPDVKYLDSFTYGAKQGLADKAAEHFLDNHGKEAIPVVTQADIEIAKKQGHEKIVLVPTTTKSLLERSSTWTRPAPLLIRKTPREMLFEFKEKYDKDLWFEIREDLLGLIEESKSWRN